MNDCPRESRKQQQKSRDYDSGQEKNIKINVSRGRKKNMNTNDKAKEEAWASIALTSQRYTLRTELHQLPRISIHPLVKHLTYKQDGMYPKRKVGIGVGDKEGTPTT